METNKTVINNITKETVEESEFKKKWGEWVILMIRIREQKDPQSPGFTEFHCPLASEYIPRL